MILDTTFLIDYLRGKPETKNLIEKTDSLLRTTIINQYELLVGIAKQKRTDIDKKIQELLNFLSDFDVLDLDKESINKAAKICGTLMQRGEPIDDNDCYIAGIALRNDDTLIVTKNIKHFKKINGIKVMAY